jgi:hypothetical protein
MSAMTAVLKYDAACRAIAEAKSFDEVRDWIDKAAAVREYGRRIKNRQLEIDAIEIRVKAKRRRGELLAAMRNDGRLRDGRTKRSSDDDRFTLEDLGISKNESSEEQRLAQIDGNSFERLVARCRAYAEAHPEKHTFDVLKPPPESGPINGARTVMASRQEPADSLDYFPTPPWATRALIEVVLRRSGHVASLHAQSCWEPACGEGHMAEVLREYFRAVTASDVHDYGYGHQADFLDAVPGADDWIVTNPPFGDNAEAFVLRALSLARVGVAMFFRLQWLETIGRYERVFAPHPPALIAQFAERVPLHKGRYEPDGATATAYLWIVWLNARKARSTEFFWIAPGCREQLTRPDDRERFTAHPVRRLQHAPPASPVPQPTEESVLDECRQPRTRVPGAAPRDDDLEIPAFLRRRPDNSIAGTSSAGGGP